MKRDVRITDLRGDIRVPASKSVLHRELIVSFLLLTLSGREDKDLYAKITLPSDGDNNDIIATKDCLKALHEADGKDVIMPCNESGSTLRFMMSVAASYMKFKGLGGRIVFKPQGRLIDRPLDQLIDCLAAHGVRTTIDKDLGEIALEGFLTDGVFEIEGNISSQYISGLTMALILMKDSSVKLIGNLESRGYFDLTLQAMRDKGIVIEEGEDGFKAIIADPGNVKVDLDAEGDWSSAAFLISLAALLPGSDVTLKGLNPVSGQKDKVIIDILKDMGVETSFTEEGLKITSRSDIKPELTLDAKDYPDIVPYIAILAAAFTKKTTIGNIERLKFKECDRVEATIKALECVGGTAQEKDGTLVITGGIASERTEEFKTYNDHRMAQTACLISAWTNKTITIDNSECTDKSFPGLWELLEEKGGRA